MRRGVPRLRQRRLARPAGPERHAAGGRAAGHHEPPLQEQPRRHLHRRHGEGRTDAAGLGVRGHGGRLRQRRLRRPLHHLLRPERALPQQRRRHLHGRDREGRSRAKTPCATAPAAPGSTTTATAASTSSSPTTSTPTLEKLPKPGENPDCRWKGVPVNCGPRGLPTGFARLYHNNGDGTFTDVSKPSGRRRRLGLAIRMTAVAADYDNDGWPDIYVACDSTPSWLFRNQHDGTFRQEGLERGVALSEDGMEQAGMGVGRRRLRPRRQPGHLQDPLLRRHERPLPQRRQGLLRRRHHTRRPGRGDALRRMGSGHGGPRQRRPPRPVRGHRERLSRGGAARCPPTPSRRRGWSSATSATAASRS